MADNTDRWIGDGSEGGQLSIESSTIKFASATQGTPFNIRLDTDDAPVTDSYYEVKVTTISTGSSLAVGLVTADGFQPGWKTKGCFYNGNITNGSAGLIIGFGGYTKEDDVVGVYQQHCEGDTSGQCNVIFYLNGRCLGAGFSLNDSNQKYYPCLHLSGSATVTFSTPPSPTVFEREQTVHSQDDPYGGDWVIDQIFTGPELSELPLPENAKFKVSFEKLDAPMSSECGGVQYQLSIKIDNSFRTAFTITGKMEVFDSIELSGSCMSTRKMPRPAFEKMEQVIQSALSSDGGFQKMIVTEEGKLVMTGPTAEIICSRFIETFEPVRSIK